MPIPREQLRLSDEELHELLSTERTLRAGTVSPDGRPHVVPLWFVWHDGAVWINNLRKARRSRDLAAGSDVALCIDTGHEYFELRGAVLYGRPHEVSADDPSLPVVRQAFGDKYFGGIEIPDTKSHVWLRMAPDRVVSWDFRKIPAGRDGRAETSKHQRDLEETRRRLATWLVERIDGARDVEISDITGPIATGYSHETLIFDARWKDDDGSQELALVARVKPSSHTVFPDDRFEIEYRVADALSGRDDIPLPRVRWYEEDTGHVGAPFFVMDKVAGEIPGDNPPYTAGGWLMGAPPEQQASVWWSGLESMAAVHRLDASHVDLPFLHRDEFEYWDRYLRWAEQDGELPVAGAALDWLREHRPADSGAPGLCWGDSRPGNQIFDGFRCVALLDWEMAAIADPEQDLGWWLYFDRLFSEGLGAPRPAGWPSHEETVARWEELTGRRARSLRYYEVFSAFRFAAILMRVTRLMAMYGQLPSESDFPVNNFATQMLERVLGEVEVRA
jgi:aminoglycoside phosphotransferase (APT) family kinase protein/nitroimidazol reductase NimA-like FMN-containing flavoprotein (pyridoxamine 5'-phosphate oxidase superfamily)